MGLVHGDYPQRYYGEGGGRGGSCLGTHIRIKDFKIKKIKKIKKRKKRKKPRGSVAKEEDLKPHHQLYKLQVKSK